jgi:hypothetical protein
MVVVVEEVERVTEALSVQFHQCPQVKAATKAHGLTT